MSVVMDHEGETYTRPIAEKTIDIKLIAGPSPCCHTERVLYTYGSPRLQSVEAARKTIRIPRGDGCKGDSDSPAMAEVSAMEHLNHQHCIRFVDVCEANGAEGGREIYILTSPIADTDLAHILGGCETCTPNTDIPSLFRCLINGLNYIHGEGIIHMDVKPSNILVLQGHLYFTDFGASLESPKPGDPIEKNGTRRTRTKAYCAPEVETGQTPQTSADIFCLGAVFLECLTVYCKPTLLSDLKKDCESGDHDEEFSWAGYHGKVLEEVRDSLKKSSSGSGFKFKNLLLLCEWMMNASESQRPSASALSQCWMYADCLGLPKPLCTSEECRSLAAFKSTDEALQAALVAGHWLAAELLCNAGADVNIRCNVQRNESWEGTGNLVHLAASHGNNRFLTFLLDQGMEVNAIDSIGSTPLHIVAENGDEDMTKNLLQREAKINAADRCGRTPFDLAYVQGREGIINLLENNGALTGAMVCDGGSAEDCR